MVEPDDGHFKCSCQGRPCQGYLWRASWLPNAKGDMYSRFALLASCHMRPERKDRLRHNEHCELWQFWGLIALRSADSGRKSAYHSK